MLYTKHTHPQTIWGQRTDGAKSGHCRMKRYINECLRVTAPEQGKQVYNTNQSTGIDWRKHVNTQAGSNQSWWHRKEKSGSEMGTTQTKARWQSIERWTDKAILTRMLASPERSSWYGRYGDAGILSTEQRIDIKDDTETSIDRTKDRYKGRYGDSSIDRTKDRYKGRYGD